MPDLTTLQLSRFFEYLQAKQWITGSEYLSSIEFGNEIAQGKGETTLKSYSVVLQ